MIKKADDRPGARLNLPILDQEFKSNPYALYDRLRSQGGSVVPVRLPTGLEAWLVTSYSAARALLRDPRLSKDSQNRIVGDSTHRMEASELSHSLFRHLLMLDPPDHTRLRALLINELSARQVRTRRTRIEQIASELLEGIASSGKADLIDAYAIPLSLKVICELVGIPKEDEILVRCWSEALFEADLNDPGRVPSIAKELADYMVRLAQSKRRKEDGSVYCNLVLARDKGALSDEELVAMGFVLLFAGYETFVNLVGNGVLALLRNPPEWAFFCANQRHASRLVDELLRFDSPLEVATQRFATSEIRFDDICIRPGEMVFIGLAAANRDPERFENPGRLDPLRSGSERHIAFGHGIHYCIGAALARLEGEVAFVTLARTLPNLELDADAAVLLWKPGLIMRGLQRLPVRFGPTR